ncbi:hypothetical protein ACTXT7_012954 [Hymenolepis weldensis]
MSVNSYFKSEGPIANTLHESAKTFSKQQWRRILTLHFKSIAKNSFYIRITRQSDARFCAIASISTLEDAQLLISHLNRRKIGNRRIYFNFFTAVDQNYIQKQNVSNRIQSEIEETVFRPPANIAPKGSQIKCGDNTDSSPAYIQREGLLLYIIQIKCFLIDEARDTEFGMQHSKNALKIKNQIHLELLSNDHQENVQEFSQQNLPSVHITLAELHSNVLKLLQEHNNLIPLTNFTHCYEESFGPFKKVNDATLKEKENCETNYVPLEHLMISIPGVCIENSTNGTRVVKLSIDPPKVVQVYMEDGKDDYSPLFLNGTTICT